MTQRTVSLGLSKYKYFPHIKYWDEQHHLKTRWNTKDYIELYKQTEIPSAAARAAAYLGDVCAKIDELGLSYAMNLRKYHEHGMPWMELCVERLPRGISRERVINVLTFLSCVGMVQNGDYVTFQKLAEVERNLPVTQRHLQDLHVVPKLLLLHRPSVWCFHESIPYKLVVPPPVAQSTTRPCPPPQEERPEDIEQEEPEEQEVQ
ncbi:hypothetical protein ABG768_019018 [Culter alburnus]|uniref:Uncharacterized protein n=1 Tax=Culter alburnus TaxID=194366 RepID=A0AAW2AWV4_CULAL